MKLKYFGLLAIMYSCTLNAQDIFDGKSLNGWKILGGKADFSVENGMIIGVTKANTPNSFLATEKTYSDFILELEFKIEDTSNNSGIMVRSHIDSTKVYGRQVEIDPSSRRWSAGIYDEQRRGWLYPLSLNEKAQNAFKADEFNRMKIE